jgi:hypothetical protein
MPSSLTNRVFALYAITLLFFVGCGLGVFLKTQFQGEIDEKGTGFRDADRGGRPVGAGQRGDRRF